MHQIKKNILTVECTSELLGKEVHSSFSEFLQKRFYPKLELLLDNYCKNNEVITLENIIIALPTLKKANWKREFISHSLLQIEEQLKSIISYKNIHYGSTIHTDRPIPATLYALNLFIEFLKNGYVTNNPVYKTTAQLELDLHKYANEKLPDIRHDLLTLLKKNHQALVRFLINTSQAIRLVLTPQIVQNINIPIVTEIENNKWIKLNPGGKALVAAYIAWYEYLYTANGTAFSTENIESFLKNDVGNKTLLQELYELNLASAPNFKLRLAGLISTKKLTGNKANNKFKTENDLSAVANPEIIVNIKEAEITVDKYNDLNTQPEDNIKADKDLFNRNTTDNVKQENEAVNNDEENKKITQKIKQAKTTKNKSSKDKALKYKTAKDILSNKAENDNNYNEATEGNKDRLNKTERSVEETFLLSNNDQPLYIENSGLVILYPFLSTLFDQLNLFKNKKWTSFKAHQKAVLITQYLVTSSSIFYENELILNRILCGFPRDKVINTGIRITKKDKSLCKDLLEAIIKHWSVLKDTSPAALQETFLIRNGKLETSTSGAVIWVEQKGVDILLAQLPWGINMVKTPWMQDFLECNWYS